MHTTHTCDSQQIWSMAGFGEQSLWLAQHWPGLPPPSRRHAASHSMASAELSLVASGAPSVVPSCNDIESGALASFVLASAPVASRAPCVVSLPASCVADCASPPHPLATATNTTSSTEQGLMMLEQVSYDPRPSATDAARDPD